MRRGRALLWICVAAGPLALAPPFWTPSAAQEPAKQQPATEPLANDKPFAEHHLVLQLSDAAPEKADLVISVANNLLAFYGPDQIAIEVVAFGPGVHILQADSSKRSYVDSLIAQGVQFDVCMNTVDTIERRTGKAPDLNPKAVKVQAGVARILALVEKGYTLVRP